MTYKFPERIFKQGNRYFIKIPFNVWEECGQRGSVPVRVSIKDCIFECRLVPKGEGIYYIPITKNIVNQINCDDEINISFEIINGLTRINHDSPYSKENPIRRIRDIQSVTYPKAGYCGQICIAMLTGLSVDEVIDIRVTFQVFLGVEHQEFFVFTHIVGLLAVHTFQTAMFCPIQS